MKIKKAKTIEENNHTCCAIYVKSWRFDSYISFRFLQPLRWLQQSQLTSVSCLTPRKYGSLRLLSASCEAVGGPRKIEIEDEKKKENKSGSRLLQGLCNGGSRRKVDDEYCQLSKKDRDGTTMTRTQYRQILTIILSQYIVIKNAAIAGIPSVLLVVTLTKHSP